MSKNGLTIEILNKLLSEMPKLMDDRIYIVDKGYWPHNFLKLSKDNGRYFILNQGGFNDLQSQIGTMEPLVSGCSKFTHFSGIKIEHIDGLRAAELISDHCKFLKPKELGEIL